MAGTFHNNYEYKFDIGETETSLLAIGGGISSTTAEFEDESEDAAYYDLNGGTETYYTGTKLSYEFEGNRKYGDEGQEFIRDRVFDMSKRNCYFKVTEPDGRIIEGAASFGEPTISGGDANARPDFKVTITFIGTPKDTKPTPKNK